MSAPQPRLLPSTGGAAVFVSAVEKSLPGDFFVVALSTDHLPEGRTDPVFAEYTHCADARQMGAALKKYRDMKEVCFTLVLQRFPGEFRMKGEHVHGD